jgi:hypothetical protein
MGQVLVLVQRFHRRACRSLTRSGARWAVVAGVLLALGFALRLALYFPLAAFPVDSDGVLAGLCAFAVRNGQHPAFFPGGYRLGSASCYVTAAFFAFAGASRTALALTGLTWSALYLAASAAFARAALGARAGCLAIAFVAFPAAAFLTVTYVPWGYGEIVASCAATLWLAVLVRRRETTWLAAAFGLSVGAGIWMSLQTAMVAVPAIVWIVAHRRPAVREWLAFAGGACAGALPWLVANVTGGFPTFAHNWVAVPVSGAGAIWSNALWFFTSPLPQLFAYGGAVTTWLPLTGGILLVLGALAASLRDDAAPSGGALRPRELAWLCAGVALATFLLDVFSTADAVRGWTVRYLAPLYVVAPIAFALGIDWLWQSRLRALAAAALALLILPNVALYDLPGTPGRAVLRAQLDADREMCDFLAGHHIALVYGNYLDIYHINFDAHGTAVAVPSIPALDYLDYGATLDGSPVAWAIVLPPGGEILEPPSRLSGGGRIERFGSVRLFVASRRSADAAGLLAALRQMR